MNLFDHGGRQLSLMDDGPQSPQGDPSPVLAIHSGGLSSRQWRGLSSLLKKSHRVLVPDLLGYGGSTKISNEGPFDFQEDVEMLAALIATLGQPAHLVGHSYGGLLALMLALKNPRSVCSLSLFEPVAFGLLHDNSYGGEPQDISELLSMQAMASDDRGGGGGEAWMEGFVDWWQGAGMWRSLPEPSRAAFLAAGRKTFFEVRSLLADRTPAAAYAKIEAPTLILSGERSPAIERRVCTRLAQALPDARLEVIAQAGHMGPLTHMAAVNNLIAAHIAAA